MHIVVASFDTTMEQMAEMSVTEMLNVSVKKTDFHCSTAHLENKAKIDVLIKQFFLLCVLIIT